MTIPSERQAVIQECVKAIQTEKDNIATVHWSGMNRAIIQLERLLITPGVTVPDDYSRGYTDGLRDSEGDPRVERFEAAFKALQAATNGEYTREDEIVREALQAGQDFAVRLARREQHIAQLISERDAALAQSPAERPTQEMDANVCAGCEGKYRYDTTIPSTLWNRVIRAQGLPEYLCAACILAEFVKAGEAFTAHLSGDGVSGCVIHVEVNGRTIAPPPADWGTLSRLTVVDENVRRYERFGLHIQADVQDQGRTLKLFVRPREFAAPLVVASTSQEKWKCPACGGSHPEITRETCWQCRKRQHEIDGTVEPGQPMESVVAAPVEGREALPPAETAPNSCRCGHPKSFHGEGAGACLMADARCGCEEFDGVEDAAAVSPVDGTTALDGYADALRNAIVQMVGFPATQRDLKRLLTLVESQRAAQAVPDAPRERET